ncbi:MAG: DsbA family protein, partial [Chloroflexi bacterium]|nr:DsbA family protein [Chloroflexota bacterium]
FWEMHDSLFEHQRALDDEHLRQYAQELGLDAERFNRDLAEHQYAGRIQDDVRSGTQSGVEGTPTLFINGVRFEGSPDLESLRSIIWEAAVPQAYVAIMAYGEACGCSPPTFRDRDLTAGGDQRGRGSGSGPGASRRAGGTDHPSTARPRWPLRCARPVDRLSAACRPRRPCHLPARPRGPRRHGDTRDAGRRAVRQ